MSDDKCKSLRETYDKCFQDFLDNVYFKGAVKGPFIPCSPELSTYHDCIKQDPKKAEYFTRLTKKPTTQT